MPSKVTINVFLTSIWVCMVILSLASSYGSARTEEMDQSTHTLTVVTRDLFNELDQKVKPVAPLQFLAVGYLLN